MARGLADGRNQTVHDLPAILVLMESIDVNLHRFPWCVSHPVYGLLLIKYLPLPLDRVETDRVGIVDPGGLIFSGY